MADRPIRAKWLRVNRDKSIRLLKDEKFSDANLAIVEYRSRMGPGPLRGANPQGSNRSSGVSDKTQTIALHLIDGRSEYDPQQKACERIDKAFRTIWAELEAAEHAWDVILHASDSIREREAQSTLGTCQACLRRDVPNIGNDRIRSGYCPNCFKAWCRTDLGRGRQDRASFELSRRSSGYGVDDIDELQANGTLPMRRASGDMGTA